MWFRLFPVRSPLLGESRLIYFPTGTEMFHFPALASTDYEFICEHPYIGSVSRFGNFRIIAYVPLPETYRSLSRPSSLPDAKASTTSP